MKVAVFSGRFDPPHLGHTNTISVLAEPNDFVIVPILDYNGRVLISAEDAKQIFENVFKNICIKNVLFIVNNIHFGKITMDQYKEMITGCGFDYNKCDVIYWSGNISVIDHMNSIGIRNVPIERSFPKIYSGTKIRESKILQ